MSKKDDHAAAIVRRLRSAGYAAYVVGGAVRDMVIGCEPKDWDIATDAAPEEVAALFDRVIPVGERFGVSLVISGGIPFEVAMFRAEGAYRDGRRPESVAPAAAREDVLRRDFTINALLYDPVTDKIIDYVGGREDIDRRLIRTVGDPVHRFTEDKLRMLRAVRFAARLDFTVEPATFAAIRKIAPCVTEVSVERIGEELEGMFTGPHPDRALTLIDDSGLLATVLPEVAAMKGVPQPEAFHPEGDVFEHTRLMLAEFGGGAATLAFAVLLHDVGKPAVMTIEDRIRFNEHDEVGSEIAEGIMRRLRFSRRMCERVTLLVRNHMRFKDVTQMRRSTLRRFMSEDYFPELLELYRLDSIASHGSLDVYEHLIRERSREEPSLPEPLISGRDLLAMGYESGPSLGAALREVRDAQLEGIVRTREGALSHAARLRSPEVRRRTRARRSSRGD